MTHSHIIRGDPPTPRLWHCPPGSTITLSGEIRPRTIDYIQGRHAVMQDGLIVSLCHPVSEECMRFGDGAGWRPLSTRSVHNPMDNPREDGGEACISGVAGCLVTESS